MNPQPTSIFFSTPRRYCYEQVMQQSQSGVRNGAVPTNTNKQNPTPKLCFTDRPIEKENKNPIIERIAFKAFKPMEQSQPPLRGVFNNESGRWEYNGEHPKEFTRSRELPKEFLTEPVRQATRQVPVRQSVRQLPVRQSVRQSAWQFTSTSPYQLASTREYANMWQSTMGCVSHPQGRREINLQRRLKESRSRYLHDASKDDWKSQLAALIKRVTANQDDIAKVKDSFKDKQREQKNMQINIIECRVDLQLLVDQQQKLMQENTNRVFHQFTQLRNQMTKNIEGLQESMSTSYETQMSTLLRNELERGEVKWKEREQIKQEREQIKQELKSIKERIDGVMKGYRSETKCKDALEMRRWDTWECGGQQVVMGEHVYFIDHEGYLLDQQWFYLINDRKELIKLTQQEISCLRTGGLLK